MTTLPLTPLYYAEPTAMTNTSDGGPVEFNTTDAIKTSNGIHPVTLNGELNAQNSTTSMDPGH